MKVTYLDQSGFLLEWQHSYWILIIIKEIFPFIERYQQEHPIPEHTCFYILKQNGQSFEIVL